MSLKKLACYGIAIAFGIYVVNSYAEQAPDQQANNQEQSSQLTFSKGETVPHKKWTYQVDQVSFKQAVGNNQFTRQEAKGKFVVIQGTVKNKTQSTNAIPGTFKVKDQQGRTYTGLGTGFQVAQEYDAEPVSNPLPPDTTMKTLMVFDVAKNVKQPVLIWDTGWGSDPKRIRLYD